MKKSSKCMFMFLAAGRVFSLVNVNNNTTVNAQDNSSSTSVSSVKDAINKLINSKNYTIEVSTKAGPIDINYEVYYTENAFYDSYLGDEYGYVQVEDGVFSFDLYQDGINRNFTASNPLVDEKGNKITSIWDEALFQGFYKLKADEFKDATGNTYEATSKRVKNLFLNLFQLDYGYYQYVNPVKFSVDNDINTFKFEFSLSNGISYTGNISNFGTTTIDVVDEYLNNGGSYHSNSDSLNSIISLFENYNYTRIMYDDKVEDYSKIAGYEMYDDFFFYTFLDDEVIASGAGYEIGMVGLDKIYSGTLSNGEVVEFEFKGSYYCFVVDEADGSQSIQVMTSMPINSDPFVPNVYNYPTFLKMFKDTQYLKSTGGNVNEFYTSKLDCVNDFISNFQMTDQLASVGAVPTGVYVQYLPEGDATYAGTNGKETVVFKLEVNYYGLPTTIDFVYTDFNNTKVDCISQERVDKYIQDIIDSAIKDVESKDESEGA